MQSYSQLLSHSIPTRLNEDPSRALPDELTLQAIWFNGLFGTRFTTTDGKEVHIRQFGFWNKTAGPDFLHCSIEINGTVRTGSLELDTHASDWEAHGHDTNLAFNDVILHVVFQNVSAQHFTRSENHSEIPKVVIPDSLVNDALQQPLHTTATASIGRCYKPLENLPSPAIKQLMLTAAKHRCSIKSKRLQLIQKAHGKDQALWIVLAETLGYRPNKQAMTQLAQRLSIHYLRKHTELTLPLLFGTAGFLHPEIHKRAPADSQQWLEDLWQEWWKHRSKHELCASRSIQWSRSGIRPINHPHRRVAAMARIAHHWSTFRKLSTQPDSLIEWLSQLTDPFWSHHYTLSSKRTDKALTLTGKDRIDALLVNHLLPLLIHQGKSSAWTYYLNIPASAKSESIQRVSTRLFGQRQDKDHFLKKEWQHQALLQIYHDFCLEDTSDCAYCPFPERLASQFQ